MGICCNCFYYWKYFLFSIPAFKFIFPHCFDYFQLYYDMKIIELIRRWKMRVCSIQLFDTRIHEINEMKTVNWYFNQQSKLCYVSSEILFWILWKVNWWIKRLLLSISIWLLKITNFPTLFESKLPKTYSFRYRIHCIVKFFFFFFHFFIAIDLK